MFISFKSIEMKDGEISYIPFLVNVDRCQCIYIEPIQDEKAEVFFGSQLVIDTGMGSYYVYGYSDEELNEIYKDIINHINTEFKGIYELPDIHEDSLYTISIYPNNHCDVYRFDLTGPIDSIKHLKERFSILEGTKVRDREHPFEYAIYYHNIYEKTHERISQRNWV